MSSMLETVATTVEPYIGVTVTSTTMRSLCVRVRYPDGLEVLLPIVQSKPIKIAAGAVVMGLEFA